MSRRTLFGLQRKMPASCLAIASSPYIVAGCTCGERSQGMKSLASWVRSRAQVVAYTPTPPNLQVWLFTLLLPWYPWWKIFCAPLQSCLFHVCPGSHPLLTYSELASAFNPLFSEPSIVPSILHYSYQHTNVPTSPSSCLVTLCSFLQQNASKGLSILSVFMLPLLHSNSQTHRNQDLIPTLH